MRYDEIELDETCETLEIELSTDYDEDFPLGWDCSLVEDIR